LEDVPNTYNILQVAGSSLGYKHTEDSIAKFSGPNHPMFGKTGEQNPFFGKAHSPETLAKISEAHKGIPKSEEHKAKLSEANKGEQNPFFGKTHLPVTKAKLSKANKGKILSPETKAKITAAKGGGTIFVYDSKGSLYYTFISTTEAAKFFKCGRSTIKRYANNGNLFKEQWRLSLSAKE